MGWNPAMDGMNALIRSLRARSLLPCEANKKMESTTQKALTRT